MTVNETRIMNIRYRSEFFPIYKDDLDILGKNLAFIFSIICDIYGASNKKWVSMTVNEIEDKSSGIFGKTLQSRLIKELVKKELIYVKRRGMPAKRYIQINFDRMECMTPYAHKRRNFR